ncbi:DMT family transporter [Qipengyuania sp. YG27]|uniref:DMT family transporter n=1 Tax=Qipengyuania mesophila TaxID=2867246 RepID=A0ABS7JVR9_9SPHN|nr:DMT family transporter [Qipengyuania mesophila]MBX7501673.1 DMT family transporter [Qipengyuania mesophila]
MKSKKTSAGTTVIIQLLSGMALFGSATPLSKIIGQHFYIFTASALRMGIACIVLAPFTWWMTQCFARAKRSDFLVILAISAFGMVGFTATMLFGMRLTSGVVGSTIMSATPAVTAGAAVLFFGAAMNGRKWGALALAVAGIAAINLLRNDTDGAGGAPLLGAALVAAAVCCEAAYTLLSKKLSNDISSLEATLAASLVAAILFVVLAMLFDPRPFDLSKVEIRASAALIFWGAATGGLAPVLWYNGAREAPEALTAGAMAIMPISALVLSYVLLGETFRWSHLIGFGLVFAGLLLMIKEHTRASLDKPQSAKS